MRRIWATLTDELCRCGSCVTFYSFVVSSSVFGGLALALGAIR